MSLGRVCLPLCLLGAFACGSDDSSNTAPGGGDAGDGGGTTDASPGSDGAMTGVRDGAGDSSGPTADSAPTGDAAPSDASEEADAPATFSCATGNYLFCEDFESYALGPASSSKWQTTTASGSDTLTIDATHVHGTKSLAVHVNSNEFAYIKLPSFAPPNNSFFGRVYAWVTAFPTAPPYAHFTMVEAAGQPSSAGVIRPIGGQYDPQGMAADWGVGSDQGPTGDWTNWKPSAPAQAGKWLCLEWEMRASDDGINVWVDGVAKTELSVTTTMHGGNNVNFVFPTWQSIWFGWWLYQANPTPNQYDLWYDDIVLSTTRVGC
jgi:hypothetical protein